MVIEGTPGVGSSSNRGNDHRKWYEGDGKPVCYTAEQVNILERVYAECQKPSHSQRQEVIRENPILCNLESKQIKVWFKNRRCAEKQRKEAIEFQLVNEKLAATNKLLLLENERLQRELLQLDRENDYIRQLLQNVSVATSYTNCESAVNPPQHSYRAADKSTGVLLMTEETSKEFSVQATRSAVDWIPIPRNVFPALLLQFVNDQSWAYAASFSFPGLNCTHFSDISMLIGHITDDDEGSQIGRRYGHIEEKRVSKICSGMEKNALQVCSELIFALIRETLRDSAKLLSSVPKVAITLPISCPVTILELSPAFSEAISLASWIDQSNRSYLGDELPSSDCPVRDPMLKWLCHHQDSLYHCSFKVDQDDWVRALKKRR